MRKYLALLLPLVLASMACAAQQNETTTSATESATTASAATESATGSAAASSTDTATTAATTTTEGTTSMKDYTDKVAEIKTTAGTITMRFYPDVAPNHVKNFIDLAKSGFYNGTKFHRVIPGFMIQGGDPNTKGTDVYSWGTGGSGKNLKAEFNNVHHARGIVSMARSQDPDSASSQFFIVVADSGFLDKQYTVFGKVLDGMDVADKIVSAKRNAQDRPDNPVAIESITIRDAKPGETGPAPTK